MAHPSYLFSGAQTADTNEYQSFPEQLTSGLHETCTSGWGSQTSQQVHSFHGSQCPPFIAAPSPAMTSKLLSEAFENVRKNNQLSNSAEALPHNLVTNQETSTSPFIPTQPIFSFDYVKQPSSALSQSTPALSTATEVLEQGENRHIPTSPQQPWTPVTSIASATSSFNDSLPHVPQSSAHSLPRYLPKQAQVSHSLRGAINLCHDCDRFLRSFTKYRRTSIHLGSGNCVNCHHRLTRLTPPTTHQSSSLTDRQPSGPTRLPAITIPTPPSSRVYYCIERSCPRSQKGRGFTRKDNRDVHIRTLHKTLPLPEPRAFQSTSDSDSGSDILDL